MKGTRLHLSPYDHIRQIDVTPFEDLADSVEDEELPWLDRSDPGREILDPRAEVWRRDGVYVAENLIDHGLIDAYCESWIRHNVINHDRIAYPGECPYCCVDSLLELATCLPIHEVTRLLIGEDMGVHLALTKWQSTERNWHQDGYLNPDHANDHYIAVWIALSDIHPDSGPFEYIRGTHFLPRISKRKVLAMLAPEERDSLWPKHSERILTPLFESVRMGSHLESEQFLARKGDVLFWHARLLHRGSVPNKKFLLRKSVILHYSGINHRPDFPAAVRHRGQGWYFPIQQDIPL